MSQKVCHMYDRLMAMNYTSLHAPRPAGLSGYVKGMPCVFLFPSYEY